MDLGDKSRNDLWLQERYARWLDACSRVAFGVTLLAFMAYVAGLLPPYVPLERLPSLWRLPLGRYLDATGAPSGWDWLRLVGHGDYLNYVGMSLFALVVLVCHAAVIGPLLRRGEKLLAAIAAAQVAVLLAAASGLFAGG